MAKPEILYEGEKSGRMALIAFFNLFGFRILIGIPVKEKAIENGTYFKGGRL